MKKNKQTMCLPSYNNQAMMYAPSYSNQLPKKMTYKQKLAEAKAAMSSFDTRKFVVDKEIFSPNRSK